MYAARLVTNHLRADEIRSRKSDGGVTTHTPSQKRSNDMTATVTPTRDWPTRTPSSLDTSAPAARVCDADKVYGRGENVVRALDGVTVEFGTGRFTAIMGPSGSGKSTLMHGVAGLDTLTSGTVLIGDTDISKLDDRKLTQLRRDRIGFIFQAFNPRLLAGARPRSPSSGVSAGSR